MPKTKFGTAADDEIDGTGEDDIIYAGGGDDWVYGFNGDDDIYGEDGDDYLGGGFGDDLIFGGEGNDSLDGFGLHRPYPGIVDGADILVGGAGDDWLRGGAGGDFLLGGSGSDTASYAQSASGVSVALLTGYAGGGDAQGDVLDSIENLVGSSHADNLSGNDQDNVIEGVIGDDMLFGFGGADELDGGLGADWLYGGDGKDKLDGGYGDDQLFGHAGDDQLTGGQGADVINGGTGIDVARYFKSNGAVTIDLSIALAAGGHAQGDALSGIENLQGSAHDDTLKGDGAANWLDGAGGVDQLKGNGGADTFFFMPTTTGLSADADTVLDFNKAQGDKIQLFGMDGWVPIDFSFIAGAAFSGAEGEVRFAQAGNETWISGDVDGDAAADFQIRCIGLIDFTAGDFIL
jgi:Ca2+-binding RTX toxin-like protein